MLFFDFLPSIRSHIFGYIFVKTKLRINAACTAQKHKSINDASSDGEYETIANSCFFRLFFIFF